MQLRNPYCLPKNLNIRSLIESKNSLPQVYKCNLRLIQHRSYGSFGWTMISIVQVWKTGIRCFRIRLVNPDNLVKRRSRCHPINSNTCSQWRLKTNYYNRIVTCLSLNNKWVTSLKLRSIISRTKLASRIFNCWKQFWWTTRLKS